MGNDCCASSDRKRLGTTTDIEIGRNKKTMHESEMSRASGTLEYPDSRRSKLSCVLQDPMVASNDENSNASRSISESTQHSSEDVRPRAKKHTVIVKKIMRNSHQKIDDKEQKEGGRNQQKTSQVDKLQ